MTDTIPPPENPSSAPQAATNPAGQQESRQKQSFRRRRKRRGQGQGPAQGPGQNAPQPAGSNSQSTSAPARTDQQPHKQKKRFFKKKQHPGQNQNQAQSRGERGNSQGNGQQRRGSKQRKAKVFVGPMDHSYRAMNGNYAEAPPSTIDLQRGGGNSHFNGNGNYNGNYAAPQSRSAESLEGAAAASLNGDSPARIYCFIDDLFFVAKIQETARKLAIKVAFVKNEKDTMADLLALPEEERPALVVVDLNNANAKPLALVQKLKQKFKRATSVVGFLSHLQGELKVKALEAGCDSVMPRSAFSQTLPNLLRRYGMEVELEDDQQRFAEI